MFTEIDLKKPLPLWWMAITELGLFAACVWFLFGGMYLEAISAVVLIELRDISSTLKSK